MSRTLSRALAAMLTLHAAHAFAQPPSPDEFAWRAPLQVPAGSSHVRIELPVQALTKLQSNDARDVRVFNAAGEAVPYAWITPAAEARPPEEKTRSHPALPLYTTTTTAAKPSGSVQVQINGERGGQSVWVRMDGQPAADARRLNSVLFATREERKPISAVEVQAVLPANTPIRVTASTSADLAAWTPASVRGRLYRFEGDGAPANLRLEFDHPLALEGRYLRLDWGSQEGVSISSVTGILASGAPTPRRLRIELPPARETAPDAAEIATGFATPIAAIALVTARDNTLVPVRVLGRNDDSQPWRSLGQTVVYRLGNNGEAVSNPPLELHGASARTLRLLTMDGATLAPIQIQAFAEFAPRQLVFVASGQGPFMLAAGRERTDTAALPSATVTGMLGDRKIEDLPLAQIGTAVEIQPSRWAALVPAAPGKSVVLWAVLGLGVLLLGAVAWSLLKQMNRSGEGAQ
jgi:hypothetical protein